MLLLNEQDILASGIDWDKTIGVIHAAVECLEKKDFSQPVKPYLRYRDLQNRIIAMPAFVGGNINMAGIKWIASFPGNIDKGIPRAHSVVILNKADTGEPLAIICTPLLSIIRTASVSGLIIDLFKKTRARKKWKIGITGFGPIGRHHLKMCLATLGDSITSIALYDIRPINLAEFEDRADRIEVVDKWEDAYLDADIFIACTVSSNPYIDKPPKAGSLHLNVSLRDYTTDAYQWFRGSVIVDDWDEVCREKTDIERMHLEKGLNKEDTDSIVDIICHDKWDKYDPAHPILFNPMGMAVFDVAIGAYYYETIVTAPSRKLVRH
jgi:N-[(2S)-2-amino-2-carboxyethyl]-L-glutamate dehydrogenase